MSSYADSLTIPISIFILAVAVVFILVLYDNMTATGSVLFTGTQANVRQTFDVLIALIPLILFGFAIGAIVAAFLTRAHPIFFVISIILFIVQMLITPFLTNMWGSLMQSNPSLEAKALSLTFVMVIMNALPLISFVISCLVAVVSYLRGLG